MLLSILKRRGVTDQASFFQFLPIAFSIPVEHPMLSYDKHQQPFHFGNVSNWGGKSKVLCMGRIRCFRIILMTVLHSQFLFHYSLLHVPHWFFILTFLISHGHPFFHPMSLSLSPSSSPPPLFFFLVEWHTLGAFSFVQLGQHLSLWRIISVSTFKHCV